MVELRAQHPTCLPRKGRRLIAVGRDLVQSIKIRAGSGKRGEGGKKKKGGERKMHPKKSPMEPRRSARRHNGRSPGRGGGPLAIGRASRDVLITEREGEILIVWRRKRKGLSPR